MRGRLEDDSSIKTNNLKLFESVATSNKEPVTTFGQFLFHVDGGLTTILLHFHGFNATQIKSTMSDLTSSGTGFQTGPRPRAWEPLYRLYTLYIYVEAYHGLDLWNQD